MRTPYAGQASATEALLPEPTPDELERERLELENKQLRAELKHLQGALEIAARVLQPYFAKLNGAGR